MRERPGGEMMASAREVWVVEADSTSGSWEVLRRVGERPEVTMRSNTDTCSKSPSLFRGI